MLKIWKMLRRWKTWEDDEYNFIMMRTVNMIMVETIIINMRVIMSNKAEGCSEDGDDDGRAARIQATMYIVRYQITYSLS